LYLIYKHVKKLSALYLVGFWLLFAHPANAMDLHCDLAENSQINPAIIEAMLEAANKGYFLPRRFPHLECCFSG